MPSPELLGPLGLTIALGIAVGFLWRDHLRADADDRRQRDIAQALNDALVKGLAGVTDELAALRRAQGIAPPRTRR